MLLDSNLLVIFADKHVQRKFICQDGETEAQIWRCIRQGLQVIPRILPTQLTEHDS